MHFPPMLPEQSALAKERRELQQQQQRTLLEAIPKDLSRPWEDPMPEEGERHLAAVSSRVLNFVMTWWYVLHVMQVVNLSRPWNGHGMLCAGCHVLHSLPLHHMVCQSHAQTGILTPWSSQITWHAGAAWAGHDCHQ